MSSSKHLQLGYYPHHEAKTEINPRFIVRALPGVTEKRKGNSMPDDVRHHQIPNEKNTHLWRVDIPDRIGRRLLIVDSNPMAGFNYDYQRRLQATGGQLGAPTVVSISLARLYELLNPYIEGFPVLGHAATGVQSTRLSIPSRTHNLLSLGIKEYHHWSSVLENTQRGGIVTFDAIMRGAKDNKPVTNPLYTPGDTENPILKDRIIPGKRGKAARSSDRLDPSMRRN